MKNENVTVLFPFSSLSVPLRYWFMAQIFKDEIRILNSTLHHVVPASQKTPLGSNTIIFSHFSKYAPYCFSWHGPLCIPRMCFPSHTCLIKSHSVPRILQNSTQNTLDYQDTKGFVFDSYPIKIWLLIIRNELLSNKNVSLMSFIRLIYQ